MFIIFLTSVVNAIQHTKYGWLNNQLCMIQPTIINLHTNEYTPGWHYYPFVFNLGRYVRSCNIYDLSNNVWVNIETEDLNLNILNMITGITE